MARTPRTLATTALVGGLVAATAVTMGVTATSADARDLTRFDDCAQLRGWYVGHAIGQVGPYGWSGDGQMMPMLVPGSAAAGSPELATVDGVDQAVTGSATGTNVQEAGVDEPDLAKTDGRLVVRLLHGRDVVITDVTGSRPREVGSYSLGPTASGGSLLLARDRVVVVTQTFDQHGIEKLPPPTDGLSPAPELGSVPVTTVAGARIVELDISDPAHPALVADDSYNGDGVSVQQYGDTVRLVLDTGQPDLPFTIPADTRDAESAGRHNREVVRASTLRDWLPAVTDNRTGTTRPVVSCDQVLHPHAYAGLHTTTVVGYDVATPETRSSLALAAQAETVYSTADRLYVAATQYDDRPRPVHTPSMGIMAPLENRTALHAFRLHGTGASYLASGHLPGTLKDRWSLDSHDGRLRVVVTRYDLRRGGTDNDLVVLSERGDRLVPTAEVTGLGRGETLQSVRWFDDLAILVTFRQVDPLFTVDLSDPDHPRPLGELEVPGYSSYLHPIGDHRLLGLGADIRPSGEGLGAQAAVFDVRDLRHPRRLGVTKLGWGTTLLAGQDPHQFTWLPGTAAAVATVRGTDGLNRQVLLRVARDGTLTASELPYVAGYDLRALPLPNDRVALVGDTVRVLSPA